ncbi:MAG: sulfatase-like hydrolase/transferase [Planctomycetota bacterium]|nr:sulfatase-like hydrolase/transferase [Planctomycetota bacterium]
MFHIFGMILIHALGATQPNVLLICVDDLKPNLGCYGDKLAVSPNIDKLAARGMRFDAAYCNQAVCSPSRNALLTGRRPQSLGIYDLSTNFRKSAPQAITLPQQFKNAGYRTEALGKIFHVGHGNHEDPASWTVPHFQAKTIGYALPENKAMLTREGAFFENKDPADKPKGVPYENADVSDETYGDGILAREAVDRLKKAAEKPTEPFFLAVGFLKPHLPFSAPKKYWDMYNPHQLPMPEVRNPPKEAPEWAPQFGGELRNYKDMPAKGAIPESTQRKLIHGYYAAMSYMDAQLGKVMDALESTGLASNTIVVLWGDHGWHLGDHGMWCKHTNYEQATRIPVIVAAPGTTRPGTATKAMVESVDIYPTLCALAKIDMPKGIDGISFASVLSAPTTKARDSVIHVYPRQQRLGRAIRTDRYRLVEWKPIGAPKSEAVYELYDYVNDPLETNNTANSNRSTVMSLATILAGHPEAKAQWRAQTQGGTGKTDRAALFERKDTNKDGKLSREEFLAKQPDPDKAPARFIEFDIDKDGFLSRDEFIHMGKKS